MLLIFFLLLSGTPRDLHVLTHSFPTRRSSDLTGFHGIPEAACYLSPVVKAPIRQDPEDIAINGWRTILLHYQRACESPSLLLQGVGMWVIRESPGIRRGKFVDKLLTAATWRLRQNRNAVHGIRKPKAMPMHRGIDKKRPRRNSRHNYEYR